GVVAMAASFWEQGPPYTCCGTGTWAVPRAKRRAMLAFPSRLHDHLAAHVRVHATHVVVGAGARERAREALLRQQQFLPRRSVGVADAVRRAVVVGPGHRFAGADLHRGRREAEVVDRDLRGRRWR